MEVPKPLQDLLKYTLYVLGFKHYRIDIALLACLPLIGVLEHQLLQVDCPVFEGKVEQVLDVEYVVEFHNVGVVELLKELYLS